jgi:putative salt-induced outer membrane protein YdiY
MDPVGRKPLVCWNPKERNKMKKLMIGLLALGVVAAAQAEGLSGFETSFNAGLTLTDGNSETLSANSSLITEGEKEGLGSVLAGVEANYGQDKKDGATDRLVNDVKAYANTKKTLSKMTFASVDLSAVHDEIAAIDYRVVAGLGLGAYVVKNEKRELSFEAGPAYLWERLDGDRDHYMTLWFAERYTCQVSETAKIWQAVKYTPKASNFGTYLLSGELGIEAAVNSRVNLRLVLQDDYDSRPAAGKERNDLSLVAGLGINL